MSSNRSESVETLAVEMATSESGTLATLRGRLDIDSSPALRSQLLAFFKVQHPRPLSIDLSGVMHIDSSGIATLIEALRIARKSNTELTLQGLQGRLLRLFEVTGILQLFNGRVEVNPSSGSQAL